MPALLKCPRIDKSVILKRARQPTRQALTTSHHTSSQISTKDRESPHGQPSTCHHMHGTSIGGNLLVPLDWGDLGKLLGRVCKLSWRWWGEGRDGKKRENYRGRKDKTRKERSQGMLTEVLRASAAGRAPGATTQAVSAGSWDEAQGEWGTCVEQGKGHSGHPTIRLVNCHC